MANVNTPITELDFDSIKASIKTYLQTQSQFKDYNFEGSNLSVLLDTLSYNTFLNNFYTNMAINEMFLDTAVLQNSIVSHAKELNYLPRSRKSASAEVIVSVAIENLSASTITIPQYTNFTTTYLGQNYNFVTDVVHICRRVSPGLYQSDTIKIYEGQVLTSFQREGFIVDDDGTLRIALSNDNADTDSFSVFVDAEQTDDANVFSWAKDIFGVNPLDKVFYVEPYFDNKYSIYFGNNLFGEQPTAAEDIRVRYRITSGVDANGASSFSTSFYEGGSISVETVTAAAGGAERESLDSIRFNAPKSLQIQERAITTNDYEILLQQRFPEISAVTAYGGEQLDPPQFGKVAIAVYLQDNTQLLSQGLSAQYIQYLDQRSPLSIEPIFVETEFVYTEMIINVYYTSKLNDKTADELEALVREAIQTYSNEKLERFNATFRQSKLTTNIDNLDTAIQSTQIDARAIIEYSPVFKVVSNPSFKFQSKLIKPYPFNIGFDNYKPAIQSTTFDIDEVCMYLQDDGLGNIMLVTDDLTNPQVINPNAGTVDYDTGEVKLIKFVATSYTGSGINIMARTVKDDIKAPKGRVFIIRDNDVKVNMILEEEKEKVTSTTTGYN